MKCAFLAPAYYTGTSFERICTSVQEAISSHELEIDYIVLGEIRNRLPPGDFDDVSFFHYQMELLQFLMNQGQTYDRILFVDFFNPGIDLVRYYFDRMHIETKMYALLHGGSFLDGDLLKDSWIAEYERAWTSLYERVYVPSDFARRELPDFISDKAVALPWGLDGIRDRLRITPTKDIDVVFPHRISDDKGIEDFCEVVRRCPSVQFVVTTPSGIVPEAYQHIKELENIQIVVCEDDDSYYETIGRAKVVLSCALQELYGYSVAEAVLSGACPVLPNRQVYPEFYPPSCLYDSPSEAATMIEQALSCDQASQPEFTSTLNQHSFELILRDFVA